MTPTLQLILLLLPIASLVCVGAFCAFQEGMILHFISKWLLRNAHINICLPVYGCLTCMASVWGTIIWVIVFGFDPSLFYILFIFALAGLNTIVGRKLLND